MDYNAHIRTKGDVRVVGSPPLLCWYGSGRHRFPHTSIPRGMMASLFGDFGYKVGVEVGVNRGENALTILENAPDVRLYLVDPWVGRKAETCYQDAMVRLEPYKDRFEVLRMNSSEALLTFKENSLDFVYLDSVRNFDGIMMDLIEWGRKIRNGGMLTGRGYCHLFDTGVADAVNAYTYAHNINNWYITREEESNFFWIKNYSTE